MEKKILTYTSRDAAEMCSSQEEYVGKKKLYIWEQICTYGEKIVHMEQKTSSDMQVTRCSCNAYILTGICEGKKIVCMEKKTSDIYVTRCS